jgi:hypothetical protein
MLAITSPSISTRPADTIIRNPIKRWPRKLRFFSTAHAWFTADVTALNTPSDAQTSATTPQNPKVNGEAANASTWPLMKSNWRGK